LNKTNYRWLVIASVALPILAEVTERLLLPELVPQGLKDAFENYLEEDQEPAITPAMVSGMLAAVVATLASIYGLLRFRHWAPGFALWSGLAMCVLLVFGGPTVQSGLANGSFALGSALWGAAIAVPYCVPEIRAAFWPEGLAAKR
jgi:hypothetical protein